jgi:hypothetical protein
LTQDFHRELARVEDMSRVVGLWSRGSFFLAGFGFGGTVLEADTVVAGLEDMAMMGKAVEQSSGHFGVSEHLMMPLILISESLMFRFLTTITLFLGPVYGWLSAILAVDRLWLCSFWPMGERSVPRTATDLADAPNSTFKNIPASSNFHAEPFAVGESPPNYASLPR